MSVLDSIPPDLYEQAVEIIRTSPRIQERLGMVDETCWSNFVPRPDKPDMFDQQESFCRNRDTISFLIGGNAAGTTEAAAYKAAQFMLHQQAPPRHDTPFWIASNTYEQTMDVCWIEKLLDHGHIPRCEVDWPRVAWHSEKLGHPKVVPLLPWPESRGGDPRKNWRIEFKSFDQQRTALQAKSIGGFWFSEQFPLDRFLETLRGCRDCMFKGGMFAEFTPIDPELCLWIEDAMEKMPKGWKFYRCNTECNRPNLADGWFESFFAAVPDEMLDTRMTGALASFEGSIYSSFLPAMHVVDDFKPRDMMPGIYHYRGIDWGASEEHPFTCYDDQTEVLTDEGWKFFSELDHEQVATVNPDNERLEFQRPSAKTARRHVGKMLKCEPKSGRANFCVTPDHRMALVRRTTKEWTFKTAEELKRLSGNNYYIPLKYKAQVRDTRVPDEADEVLTIKPMHNAKKLSGVRKEDFARMLGLWIAEGDLRHGKRNEYIRIAQKEYVEEVRQVVQATGWNWHECKAKTGVVTFSLCSKTLADFLVHNDCDHKSAGKRIPRFVLKWGIRCLEALLEGLWLGDGRKGGLKNEYFTISHQLASDVQELGALLGRPVFVSSRKGLGPNGKPHVLYTCRFVRSHGASSNLPIEEVDYDGMVYCVTVPNGTLVVRRHGKTMVCGNCVWAYRDGIGDWVVYDEYWSTEQSKITLDHVQEIVERSRYWGWQGQWKDRTDKDSGPQWIHKDTTWHRETFADPSRPGEINEFNMRGIATHPAGNDVFKGIDCIRSLLKPRPPDGNPKIKIARHCKHLIQEMRKYRWMRGKKPTSGTLLNPKVAQPVPLKRDDDTVDALRYLIYSAERGRGAVPGSMSHREFAKKRRAVQLGDRNDGVQLLSAGRRTNGWFAPK